MEPYTQSRRARRIVELSYSFSTAIIAACAITLLAGFSIFDLSDGIIHPLVLRNGKPVTAIVTTKFDTSGRSNDRYLRINYKPSPIDTANSQFKVNALAYGAISINSRVQIHFIPGYLMCVTLDNDYGYALLQRQGCLFIFLFASVALWIWVSVRKPRANPEV